jgi:hypothetical protein
MEQTDGVKITQTGKGRDYRMTKLHHFKVDGYCAETSRVYEYYECHWHGQNFQPFRDDITTNGDTLAVRYQQTCNDWSS